MENVIILCAIALAGSLFLESAVGFMGLNLAAFRQCFSCAKQAVS